MTAYVEGDAAAFEALFRRVLPALRAFLSRYGASRAATDDLLQATLLKVHAARGSWRRGERLRPWLFTVAARVRIDEHRRQERAMEEPLPEREGGQGVATAVEAEGAPSAEAGLIAHERGGRVRAALEALPEAQREVVRLHRFEGLSFAEIGAALGITEGAAKLRAFRAYERLREALADLVKEAT